MLVMGPQPHFLPVERPELITPRTTLHARQNLRITSEARLMNALIGAGLKISAAELRCSEPGRSPSFHCDRWTVAAKW
jgi:hypothetical protein